MLDNNDLQALKEMMSSLIAESEERTSSRIAESEERTLSRIAESEERTLSRIAESEERTLSLITESEGRSAALVTESERRMMTYIENTVGKDIKLVAEGLTELIKRVPDVDRQVNTEYRVSTLEHVAENHAARLNELEKKAQ